MRSLERQIPTDTVVLSIEHPTSETAQKCLAGYYRELAGRFEQGFDPTKSISANPRELVPLYGYFVTATVSGKPVGCVALKFHEDFAEIKRMWVDDEMRGLGIGRRILRYLESLAERNNIGVLRLETKRTLKEAQALYRSSGYQEVAPFNDEPYAHHWFEKRL